MKLGSAIYTGSVMHRRFPQPHRFRYRVFWLLLDLDELSALTNRLRLFSYNRKNLFAIRDQDHGDGTATPLRDQIRRLLTDAGIDLDGGRIALLCMPRTLGYDFNPLSVYFCADSAGDLRAIVYQVHNTFGDRHSYVFPVTGHPEILRHSCAKRLYVSPFIEMDMTYDFRVSPPDDRVSIAIGVKSQRGAVLHASLSGGREELTDRALLRVFFTVPLVALKAMVAIHFEALRLWLKKARFHHRPPMPARTMPSDAPAQLD